MDDHEREDDELESDFPGPKKGKGGSDDDFDDIADIGSDAVLEEDDTVDIDELADEEDMDDFEEEDQW